MHKQPKDLAMPEDLRVGPQMRMNSPCDTESVARLPMTEPGEMGIFEADSGSDACVMQNWT